MTRVAETVVVRRGEQEIAGPAAPTTDAETGRQGRDLAMIRIVAGREIGQQLRNKNFWMSLLVTVFLIFLSFGLTVLLDKDAELPEVAVPAGRPGLAAALQSQAEVREYPTADAARAAVRDGTAEVALIDNEVVVLRKLPDELARTLDDIYRVVTYQERLQRLGATEADLAVPALRLTTLDPDAARVQQRTITAGLAIFALVMLIFMSGLSIAQGVAEEKASRIVEVLLAKVRPWHLLAGKIGGLGVSALVQISVILGAGLTIALTFDVFDAPVEAIGTVLNVLLWFIPGFLLFATLYAVAGSLVSRPEDVNHVVGPVNMLQMGTVIGPVLAVTSPDSPLLTVVSMVPGLSWAAMPVRMAYSSVPWWQVVVALALTLLAVAVLLRMGNRVYTGNLLRYGGVIKLKEALRAARH
ncbi:MAG TPA: ABC transporter permease [Micromonospora sp.]|nr:ABC transporter permease [Micromonospora sp.]